MAGAARTPRPLTLALPLGPPFCLVAAGAVPPRNTPPAVTAPTHAQEARVSKRTFHLKWPRRKHEENSDRGIREAARRGFKRIDLDLLITKDGVVVGCHWPRPMRRDGFRDPKGKLKRSRTVASMTWAEVSRLRTKKRDYRIQRVEHLIDVCAREGVEPLFEPKDDKRFEDPETWRPIKERCDEKGLHPTGYSLRSRGRGKRRVAAMRKAGIPAHLLRH